MSKLTVKDFIIDHPSGWFPPIDPEPGRWIALDHVDPPFTKGELKTMVKTGIIVLDEKNERYYLTEKAAILKKEYGGAE